MKKLEEFEPQLLSVRSVLYMIAWTIGCATAMFMFPELPVWALTVELAVFLFGFAPIIVFSMAMDEKDFDEEKEPASVR